MQESLYPEDGRSTLLWNNDISQLQDFMLQWEANHLNSEKLKSRTACKDNR